MIEKMNHPEIAISDRSAPNSTRLLASDDTLFFMVRLYYSHTRGTATGAGHALMMARLLSGYIPG
jgi:hypothetical protein